MSYKITLRAARVNAGLTIEKAAAKLGINRDTLSRWERGRSYPSVLEFKLIEKLYKVKYEDIEFKQ